MSLAPRYQLPAPVAEPTERWMHQVTEGSSLQQDLQLDCEVVVIGSGAGGAACAYELASRNRAVLLIEEGKYFRRKDFNGRPSEMLRTLYRRMGLTASLGNTVILKPSSWTPLTALMLVLATVLWFTARDEHQGVTEHKNVALRYSVAFLGRRRP